MNPANDQVLSSREPESRTLVRLWYAGLVLAAVLRVVLIERHGLWNNEMITLGVLPRSYAGIIAERLSVNHMPLYFLIEKAWTDIFGLSEASLRAIGAFFGWMAVWATGRLARRLGGLRFAVPVVFAAAVHQLWLSSSLEARMYSMLTWAAVESTDAWFAWTRSAVRQDGKAERSALLRWTLVTVLGIYCHMLYGVILLFQLIDLAVRKLRQGIPLKRFSAALGSVALLCIPISIAWFVNQNKFDNSPSDLEFRTPGILLRRTLLLLWGDYKSLDFAVPVVAAYVLLLVALVGLIAVYRSRPDGGSGTILNSPESKRDLMALGVAYLIFLVSLFFAQAFSSASMMGEARYYAGLFPAVLILGAAGILHWLVQSPKAGAGIAGLALLLQVAFASAYYTGVGEGFREGVAIVRGDLPENRGVVCVLSGGAELGLDRYYGKDIGRPLLYIDRYEKSTRKVRDRVDRYTQEFPEFWVLSYHEKRETLWKVLDRAENGYRPLNEEQELGKTKVQLYVRTDQAVDATSDGAANPVPASD